MANREQLNAEAKELGIEGYEELETNKDVKAAIDAAKAEAAPTTPAENEGGEEEEKTGAELDGTQELENAETPRAATASAIEQAQSTAKKNAKKEARENKA